MKTSSCILLLLGSVVLAVDPPTPTSVTTDNVYKISAEMKRMTREPYMVPAAASFACGPARVQNAAPEPYTHATLGMHVYFNTLAEEAMGKKAASYPVGAMVVKEKLDTGGNVTGVGGMIKRAAGFDADNGDWEYFYADKKAGFSMGKMDNCANCHSEARKTDFVFARWLKK